MTDWLINLDHSITLGLNGMHTPFWNEVMLFLSAKTVWIPIRFQDSTLADRTHRSTCRTAVLRSD